MLLSDKAKSKHGDLLDLSFPDAGFTRMMFTGSGSTFVLLVILFALIGTTIVLQRKPWVPLANVFVAVLFIFLWFEPSFSARSQKQEPSSSFPSFSSLFPSSL